jgi:hypothetical protein
MRAYDRGRTAIKSSAPSSAAMAPPAAQRRNKISSSVGVVGSAGGRAMARQPCSRPLTAAFNSPILELLAALASRGQDEDEEG